MLKQIMYLCEDFVFHCRTVNTIKLITMKQASKNLGY